MLKNKDFSSLVKRNLEECHLILNKKQKAQFLQLKEIYQLVKEHTNESEELVREAL